MAPPIKASSGVVVFGAGTGAELLVRQAQAISFSHGEQGPGEQDLVGASRLIALGSPSQFPCPLARNRSAAGTCFLVRAS